MKSMSKIVSPSLALLFASTMASSTQAVAAKTHQAKVAIADARAKALTLVAGTLVKEELEHEDAAGFTLSKSSQPVRREN